MATDAFDQKQESWEPQSSEGWLELDPLRDTDKVTESHRLFDIYLRMPLPFRAQLWREREIKRWLNDLLINAYSNGYRSAVSKSFSHLIPYEPFLFSIDQTQWEEYNFYYRQLFDVDYRDYSRLSAVIRAPQRQVEPKHDFGPYAEIDTRITDPERFLLGYKVPIQIELDSSFQLFQSTVSSGTGICGVQPTGARESGTATALVEYNANDFVLCAAHVVHINCNVEDNVGNLVGNVIEYNSVLDAALVQPDAGMTWAQSQIIGYGTGVPIFPIVGMEVEYLGGRTPHKKGQIIQSNLSGAPSRLGGSNLSTFECDLVSQHGDSGALVTFLGWNIPPSPRSMSSRVPHLSKGAPVGMLLGGTSTGITVCRPIDQIESTLSILLK
ncbi:MAG: hypothetical protein NUV74_09830 [Candidatus Brocadiaceae bacterium]|nr:hypothetical protein [Candidatus Brocadiaceae bacterium]